MGFDRQAGRFLPDKPDLHIVFDDRKMMLKAVKISGRHRESEGAEVGKKNERRII